MLTNRAKSRKSTTLFISLCAHVVSESQVGELGGSRLQQLFELKIPQGKVGKGRARGGYAI